MLMRIPEYRLKEWRTHLKRIVDNAKCDPSDTKTANAIRLAKKDLRRMDNYLEDNDKTGEIPREATAIGGEAQ